MAAILHEVRDLARFNHILGVMAEVGLHNFIDRLKLRGKQKFNWQFKKNHPYSTPEKLRVAFEKLGPTFIKFGQLLSVRPDLVPKEYVDEFSKLQDSVHEESWEDIKQQVESELGGPVHKFFKHFSQKPLSAASIAQVHMAVLKSGEIVAVKVQRPNIQDIIDKDVHILTYLAKLVERYVEDSHKYNPQEVVDEFSKWIKRELDFFIEARNAEKFYQNFKGVKDVKIPKIYWDYSTKKILTMEYIEGKKLKELKLNTDAKQKILKTIAEASMKQIIEDGFFHADPHPGNIIIMSGNRVAFIDYGVVGNIDDQLKEQMAVLLMALLDKNVDDIVNVILDMNISDEEVNVKKFRQDLRENLNIYYIKNTNRYAIQDLANVAKLSTDHKIRLPIDFVLLTKAVLTLDGLAMQLDPSYSVVDKLSPYMKDYADKRKSLGFLKDRLEQRGKEFVRFADKLPAQLTHLFRRLEKGKITLEVAPKEIKELSELTREVEGAAEKMALALMIGAIAIAAALFGKYETLPFILGWPLSRFIFLIASFFAFWMIISILRGKG